MPSLIVIELVSTSPPERAPLPFVGGAGVRKEPGRQVLLMIQDSFANLFTESQHVFTSKLLDLCQKGQPGKEAKGCRLSCQGPTDVQIFVYFITEGKQRRRDDLSEYGSPLTYKKQKCQFVDTLSC